MHIVLPSRCRTGSEADISGSWAVWIITTTTRALFGVQFLCSLTSQLATPFLTDTHLCPVMTHPLNELDYVFISTLILTIISLFRSCRYLVLWGHKDTD